MFKKILCSFAILSFVGMAILSFIENKTESEYGYYPIVENVYTDSCVMEIGGFYRFKLSCNGNIIKDCEAKVRAESITFISTTGEEVNEYKHFDRNTISLYNENKTACMIMNNHTDKKGNLTFDLIGTITDDIAGSYNLIYTNSEITSEVEWMLTGEAYETNRMQGESSLDNINTYMCLSTDDKGDSYIRICDNNTWKTYTFALLGKTLYLTEVTI